MLSMLRAPAKIVTGGIARPQQQQIDMGDQGTRDVLRERLRDAALAGGNIDHALADVGGTIGDALQVVGDPEQVGIDRHFLLVAPHAAQD